MIFVAANDSFEVDEPTDGAFHDPAVAVTTNSTEPVLGGRLLSSTKKRADKFNTALFQRCAKPVGIGGTVVDQPLQTPSSDQCSTFRRSIRNRSRFQASTTTRCSASRDGDASRLQEMDFAKATPSIARRS